MISWATAEAFQFGNFLDGAFHAFRQLRIEDDVAFALAFEGGGSDGFAKFVAGAARIFTRIFRINWRDLQDHETEITEGADARARLQRLAIEEPFDLSGSNQHKLIY